MTRPILHRQVSWTDAASYAPDLYASLAAVTLPDSGNISRGCVRADFAGRPKASASANLPTWAMPSARAADASHSSLLRVSTIGGIAIAAWCIVYFAAQMLRAVLS